MLHRDIAVLRYLLRNRIVLGFGQRDIHIWHYPREALGPHIEFYHENRIRHYFLGATRSLRLPS